MRIAHITDPHLRHHLPGSSAIPRRRSREAAELLADAAADAKTRGADVIVLTGDLVDVPMYLFGPERDAEADEPLWAAARADYRLVRRILDGTGLPWIALPGNHDSHRLVAEELGDGAPIRDVGGVRFVSFWDREVHHNRPQRILAERHRFDQVLAEPGPLPQVHLQHYVISPVLDEEYPHTYLEGHELLRRISESTIVRLVLSGHYHVGVKPAQHGGALLSVTPALTESPHPYRLFDLDPQSGRTTWEQVDIRTSVPMKPAIFLDRDGCINTLASYTAGPEAMELIPGAAGAIRKLREAGYRVVVITNQSCIGLGYATPAVVEEVNDRMSLLLAAEGAVVDAIYTSPQAGERAIAPEWSGDDEAKPSPAMLLRAAAELRIDIESSWMVGDRWTDVEAALTCGATPVLVLTGAEPAAKRPPVGDTEQRYHIADDLPAAARLILDGARSRTAGLASAAVGSPPSLRP
ncbi:HAD-IIIA family hydrolase [Microbacterium sp.]|uniref:HAD-IIIA family hydrolase n=1 Tax=Microbacterium sp. TaxID=51671 RepID=UPI00281159C1|nr:HAD-IIIA family hydrolase [Microbacterium sp.]